MHASICFLFSRSALRHQQRFRFHHPAFRSDAGWILGGARSIDRSRRSVGQSLAISLGTGGGSDFDCTPLVFIGTRHIGGDVVDSCVPSAPSKRRRRFDGSCFYFASCGNINRPPSRWVDGAYSRRKRKGSRRRLVSGGKSRRQWHRWGRRRLARESFLEGDRRRRTRHRDARLTAAIYFASDVRIVSTETLGERMRILWG